MWADLGFWRGTTTDGTFHIHGVTGPDEYTTVVNDNLFTNVMARFNLRRAAEAVRRAPGATAPEAYAAHGRRGSTWTTTRSDEWERARRGDGHPVTTSTSGVHPQDQHFLEREVWDLEHTPLDKRPLLLHYHPLVIYRFQVLKQADVVLALFLQGDQFTAEEKRADFEYYDPITTGDSTLSAVVQSIIAAEVGYHDLALRYFLAALFVDLADLHGNTSDGVHVASTRRRVERAGLRLRRVARQRRDVSFDPRLPEEWESLTFRLTLRGSRLTIVLTATEITFEITDGDAESIDVVVRGEPVTVGRGVKTTVPLAHQGHQVERKLVRKLPVVSHTDEHEMLYTAGVPDPYRRGR